MIQVTQAAYREIVRLSQHTQANLPPSFQIGSEAGGCLGQVYTLSFGKCSSDATDQSDITLVDCLLLESGGTTRPLKDDELQLSANPSFLSLLEDLVLDYSEDLMGGNFRFVNPNLNQTCSCGQSFKLS